MGKESPERQTQKVGEEMKALNKNLKGIYLYFGKNQRADQKEEPQLTRKLELKFSELREIISGSQFSF